MSICIIPARGGSKRIPNKNIRKFCGRPLIAWSIAAALQSGAFARVVVSTDDPEIASVARANGAEVPFERPAELATDHTSTQPVIAHAINTLGLPRTERAMPVCCLYATAPFVTVDDLRRALLCIGEDDTDLVMAITTFAFPVQRALRKTPDGNLAMLHPEHMLTRSQDLEEAFHDAGQFYVAAAAHWCGDAPIFGAATKGIDLPRTRVQDIDTEEDWHMAELLFRAQDLQRSAPGAHT